MSEIAISLKNVSKCFKRYPHPVDRLKEILLPGRTYAQEFWALRDINLEVFKGQTVGIIGRNGSGKSTLLQIIAGTLTPTSGSIEVNGRIGALLELGSGFNPEFTGRENVFLNGAILGLSRQEMEQRFDEIAAFADIGDFIDQPVQTYSSGMVVRLAFAVSVNIEPDILIIDEALAVGDAAFQFKCFERLEHLTQSGVTILFVSHDIGAVKLLCEDVLYLVNGKERGFGSPDDLAELYFLDMRDEQRKLLSGSSPVKKKHSLAGDRGIAFGTDEGRIIQAEFIDIDCLHGAFALGDEIKVKFQIEFLSSLNHPSFSLFVQDRKMLPIGGQYLRLSKTNQSEKIIRQTVIFSFKVSLAEGNYFLTAVLEERQSDNHFFPIDKQSKILTFEVLPSSRKKFLGIVDLKIKILELAVDEIKS
ncbi:ABC transporter ATP-binding protein [Coleofasciculus sp. FACHB-1120]|uniref:ABC transporter ATP-binding protein n=1 Tax=Coleofasciculus sp. FACHB-1120 TaxID=2692783 RepID=UPI0016835790|nr:ABC transporter ATP-binding protein [Coleofasciculus sp. FACHB-1120]MBD2743560.1 ABC transporter ATP-binding protein [Coleofasciculus sp. FACHB-1120]